MLSLSKASWCKHLFIILNVITAALVKIFISLNHTTKTNKFGPKTNFFNKDSSVSSRYHMIIIYALFYLLFYIFICLIISLNYITNFQLHHEIAWLLSSICYSLTKILICSFCTLWIKYIVSWFHFDWLYFRRTWLRNYCLWWRSLNITNNSFAVKFF